MLRIIIQPRRWSLLVTCHGSRTVIMMDISDLWSDLLVEAVCCWVHGPWQTLFRSPGEEFGPQTSLSLHSCTIWDQGGILKFRKGLFCKWYQIKWFNNVHENSLFLIWNLLNIFLKLLFGIIGCCFLLFLFQALERIFFGNL